MKLRVRVNKQTSQLELQGEKPTLTELEIHIREIILPAHGLGPDTEFTLSLNRTESLSNIGQTLSSCGIVSGDLICVILPQSVAMSAASPSSASQAPSSSTAAPEAQRQGHAQQSPLGLPMFPSVPSTSTQATAREGNPKQETFTGKDQEEPGSYVWDPMLCSEAEEGKVPLSLAVLHQGAQSCSSTDCLMVAVHLLMLETGFIPQGAECRLGEMPEGWRAAGGVYRLRYAHPLCEGSVAMVVAVSMGPLLVINATLKVNETVDTVRKLSLNPSSFVINNWEGRSAAAVYKDLKKLSRMFRDQLVYPLLAAAREAMALPAVFGLCALPPELLLRILRLLDVRSLVALSATNTHLRNATEDNTLWQYLYHRDFGNAGTSTPPNQNWKELYMDRFKVRDFWLVVRMPQPCPLPPLPPPFPRPLDPFNPLPYPPGIIGGEYDQRPGVPLGVLPRPYYNPIGPFPGGGPIGRRGQRPPGGRPSDIRRGFI